MKAFSRALVLTPSPTHPQNFGNRNRIFNVCSAIKARGVSVDLLHYPSEWDWRINLPGKDMQRMHEAWDEVFTIPPSRPLHTYAIGEDHLIDEWWDEGIGNYLQWLFSVRRYSHFIVNYTWLSRAFEFAPPDVLKILDTHDRFSGRRQLLASLGVGVEFFHTTPDQEKIALDRADVVLAIKDEEQAFFASLTDRRLMTLIHSESAKYVPVAPLAPETQPRLRLGFLGARNSINKENFRAFLDQMVPAIRNTMASVDIVLAGGLCFEFQSYQAPELELMGYVDSVETFYHSVDAVVAPIERSTGLKIKVGEALAHGKPLIAMKHAFEGYETTDRLQQIETMHDFVKECINLSFDRTELTAMGLHARISHRRSILQFENTINALVGMRASNAPGVVVTVDKSIGSYRSATGNRQIDLIRYLSHIAHVYIYVAEAMTTEELRAFEDFSLPGTKVISRLANSGDIETSVTRASLSMILGELPISTIWVSALPDDEVEALETFGGLVVVDTSLYLAGALRAPALANGNEAYFAYYPGSEPSEDFWPTIEQRRKLPLPYFMSVQAEINPGWRNGWSGPGMIVLSDRDGTAALAAAAETSALAGVFHHATLVWDDTAPDAVAPKSARALPLSRLRADLRRIGEKPTYCIDTCVDNPAMNFVREMMLRFDVPLLPIARLIRLAKAEAGPGETLADLADRTGRCRDEFDRVCLSTRAMFESDAGWCQIWGLVSHAQRTAARPASAAA